VLRHRLTLTHFIAIHLQEMTGGQTYSQVSAAAMAAPPGSAKATALIMTGVATVFQGDHPS